MKITRTVGITSNNKNFDEIEISYLGGLRGINCVLIILV